MVDSVADRLIQKMFAKAWRMFASDAVSLNNLAAKLRAGRDGTPDQVKRRKARLRSAKKRLAAVGTARGPAAGSH